MGQCGLAGAVVSHQWAALEPPTMVSALTCVHSADPIVKMSQWICLLKVLVVSAHERDAEMMVHGEQRLSSSC